MSLLSGSHSTPCEWNAMTTLAMKLKKIHDFKQLVITLVPYFIFGSQPCQGLCD